MQMVNFGWTGQSVGGGSPIGGGGTLNYIAKFTPDGVTIGNSQLFDNGVSVGINNPSPDASAKVDIVSTTQGFLAPRMTQTQRNAIASPATSLFIYNTTSSKFNFWDGAVWQTVDSTILPTGETLAQILANGNTTGGLPIVMTSGDTLNFSVGSGGTLNSLSTTGARSWSLPDAGGTIMLGSGTTNKVIKWTNGPNSVSGDSTITDTGTAQTFAPSAASSGAVTAFTFTNPSNTNQTLQTEINGIIYNGGSRQWATGDFSSQREVYITSTTYSAVGATTITNAFGLYVSAPIAGTNMTITKNWAFGTNGNASISGNLNVSGNITSATWNGSVIAPVYGGTGVANNNASTLTISGNFASTFTVSGAFNYTFPTATSTLLANNLGLSGGTTLIGGTAATDNLILQSTSANATTTANAFTFKGGNNGASTLATINNNGSWALTTVAAATGAVINYNFSGAADTNQTLQTEINRVLFTTSTRQWATGNFATQREFLITAPTYSFVGASTITTAATFAVSGAPTVGTNATFTQSYNTWLQGGGIRIDDGTIAGQGIVLKAVPTITNNGGLFIGVTPSGTNPILYSAGGAANFNSGGGSSLNLQESGNTFFTANRNRLQFLPLAINTGTQNNFTFTIPANTNQTQATEINGFKLNGGSRQWVNGGAITLQREVYISTPTYSFTAASTITDAFTFYVESPTIGTNATITRNWSAGFNGNVAFSSSIFVGSLTTAPTALIHMAAGTASASTAPLKFTSGTNLTVAEAGAQEYDGTTLWFTNSGVQRQELIQSQQGRVTADFNKTTDITLANVAGLTATLVAGKTYTFYAKLFVNGDAVGGAKYTIASDGTLSATDVKFQINSINNATNLFIINSRVTALGTSQSEAVASATSAWTEISGTITVNVGGVISVQFAQSVSNGTSSVLRGSYFVVNQVA